MAMNRNIADFYNEIQSHKGLRYSYQFLVKLDFEQRMFDPSNRGRYSEIDNVLISQYGFNLDTLGELTNPNPSKPENNLTFLAQSTSLPQTKIGTVPVAYFAQGFRFPGLIEYDKQWTINILLDQQLTIYRQLRLWQEMMSSIARNSGGNKTIPNVRADIQLLNQYGNQIERRYFVEGIFPTDVPNIDMTYNQGSSNIKRIDVQFQMQYFRQVDPSSPTTDLFAEYNQ